MKRSVGIVVMIAIVAALPFVPNVFSSKVGSANAQTIEPSTYALGQSLTLSGTFIPSRLETIGHPSTDQIVSATKSGAPLPGAKYDDESIHVDYVAAVGALESSTAITQAQVKSLDEVGLSLHVSSTGAATVELLPDSSEPVRGIAYDTKSDGSVRYMVSNGPPKFKSVQNELGGLSIFIHASHDSIQLGIVGSSVSTNARIVCTKSQNGDLVYYVGPGF